MARKKTSPVEVAPEDESQEIHELEEQNEPEPKAPATMSKAAAAKAALEAGIDSPKEAIEYAMEHFGVEIKGADFSAVKSRYKTKEAPAPVKKSRGATASPPKANQAPQNGHGDILEGLQTLKSLIGQYGVDQVRKMVDVLE